MLQGAESYQIGGFRALRVGLLRFFSSLPRDMVASLLVVVLTFCFATAVTAGILWYYQWPLMLSPVGGFIVLGVMLLFWYDS